MEEVRVFAVGANGLETSEVAKQHCIAIEQPNLTLVGVVEGMLNNRDCQTDPEVRKRYVDKVFSVLRVIAKALRHLHSLGIVHGSVSSKNCGKYANRWKVGALLSMCMAGEAHHSGVRAHPSIDVLDFGKLSYEVSVGETLKVGRGTEEIARKLRRAGVSELGVELVLACLHPVSERRPTMIDVLKHPMWKELRRQKDEMSG